MPPSLLLLRHFLAIHRAGSIGRAATALGLSQPGLSKSLRRLEADLGVPLFARSSTGIVPTAYGEALARRAEVIEAEGRRALEEVAQIGGALVGETSIGVGPAIANTVLPDTLPAFLQARPKMRVSVFEGLYETLVDRLRAGALDFAITTRPFVGRAETGVDEAEFRRDRFVAVAGASHPLAGMRSPLGPRLVTYPWVLPPRGGIIWPRFIELFIRKGLRPPEPQVETNSTGLMLSLIQAGLYLTCVPEALFAREIEAGRVLVLRDPAFIIEREVVVLTRSGTFLSPAAEALLAALRAGPASTNSSRE